MPFATEDLRKFSTVGRAIADAAEITMEQWIEIEAGAVTKEWAELVSVSSEDSARFRSRSKTAADESLQNSETHGGTVNTGGKGGSPGLVWIRTKGKRAKKGFSLAGTVDDSGRLTFAWRHYKTETWAKISSAVAAYAEKLGKAIPAGQKAIGLARGSVVQIADSLGILLENVKAGNLSSAAIAQAREARPSDGSFHQNGRGIREKGEGTFFIELINSYPALHEAGIDTALDVIVARRLTQAQSTLNAALSKNLAYLQRQFPYLKTS